MHVWYRFYLGYIDNAVLQSRTNLLSEHILAATCSNQITLIPLSGVAGGEVWRVLHAQPLDLLHVLLLSAAQPRSETPEA